MDPTSSPGRPHPRVVGIAGGSGSGKSTLARTLSELLGARCLHLEHDRYYKPLPAGTDPAQYDFDRPEALETARLLQDLESLRAGRAVDLPCYDFTTHRRLLRTQRVEPPDWIVLEGILVLWEPALRECMDLRVYVDAPEGVRFERRVLRDRMERGRDPDGVLEHLRRLRPMHRRYVEPCREMADLVIDGTREPRSNAEQLVQALGLTRPRAAP